MRTPDIRAWNQRVTGKNQSRIIRATMATAIQIITIPTEEIMIEIWVWLYGFYKYFIVFCHKDFYILTRVYDAVAGRAFHCCVSEQDLAHGGESGDGDASGSCRYSLVFRCGVGMAVNFGMQGELVPGFGPQGQYGADNGENCIGSYGYVSSLRGRIR